MDYELAKQLKNAGFPQDLGDHFFYTRRGPLEQYEYHFGVLGPWQTTDTEHAIVAPTLEELIEACGDSDFLLVHDADGWYARNSDGSARHCKTPEEALARLWLTLQPIAGKGDTPQEAVKDLWRKMRPRPYANGDASA